MNLDLITVKDIAQMTGMHVGTVRDRLVHKPTFPKPVPFCSRPKKWIKERVESWLRGES